MNVPKTLSRLSQAPQDPEELRRVARTLASTLHSKRGTQTNGARAYLAQHATKHGDFAAGYSASLCDIAVEHSRAAAEDDDIECARRLLVDRQMRELLARLAVEPARPRALAEVVEESTAQVAERLDHLAAVGLVQAYAAGTDERHMAVYRATRTGRRLLDELGPNLSTPIEQGIRLAVSLFDYLAQHQLSPASALHEIAEELLHDPAAAVAAVRAWAEAASERGLVDEFGSAPLAEGTGAKRAPGYRASTSAAGELRSAHLWREAPALLEQLGSERAAPVYVRTDPAGWSAWAFALNSRDHSGRSRTIVDGDILAQSVSPPEHGFDLVYDRRDTLDSDSREPTMRAFLERAEQRFLIAADDEDVPEGFIRLAPPPPDSDSDNAPS
ncbi:hypothetical protein [Haliangium ochraceum]|uniref:Uncharacterized protein n=1 Tax=Haliangium ochraceum (strain DSM 14365 / JCM 11303 / SMP-2) TaxID=502025 RepID=D0LHY5_HALO1|nr:hypothetical protein [Haliangium ochraceum]ACY14814.1 hypothetical protein Hoch_2271 [Haliangium ochraceum DSM 14365]